MRRVVTLLATTFALPLLYFSVAFALLAFAFTVASALFASALFVAFRGRFSSFTFVTLRRLSTVGLVVFVLADVVP